MIIWIIGMSSSGKTTLGKEMMKYLRLADEPWVFLDGDVFRHVLGEDQGHTLEARRKNAERISRFCEILDLNGVNVLACVLSLFHDNQRYNREHFSQYREVYLDVRLDKLEARDNKGLYAKARKGECPNVVGVDIPFTPPYAPDFILDNNQEGADHSQNALAILRQFGISSFNRYPYSSKNRLLHPERYQYSPYLGEPFFESYATSRTDAIRALEAKMARWNPIPWQRSDLKALAESYAEKLLQALDRIPDPALSSATEIVTKKFLFETLVKVLKQKKVSPKDLSVVHSLLRNFEISKKLFTRYSLPEVKRASDVFDEALSYPLFALLLIEVFRLTEDVAQKTIYFNALAKLADLIISIQGDLMLPEECALARFALEHEQRLFKDVRNTLCP